MELLHRESHRPGSMFPYISLINGFFDVVDWDKAADEYEKCLGHFE